MGDVTVSMATLEGEVSGNTVTYTDVDSVAYTATNMIDNGSFSGAAGLNQAAQNSGANSLIQQQVNFQGNIDVNP